jgi:CheY-like chemotaxis protein
VGEDRQANRVRYIHYLRGQYLRGEPIELAFAAHGREVVDRIRRGEQFDLILMNMDRPVLNGLDAARAVRALEKATGAPATPIVALSVHSTASAVEECRDAGCVAHVAEPVDSATLLSIVHCHARRVPGQAGVSLSTESAGEVPVAAPDEMPDEVAALVPRYLASKHKQIAEARASLAAKNFEPVDKFGHNLKGTGRGYGFPEFETIGTEIQKAAAKLDERSVGAQLDRLIQILAEHDTRAVRRTPFR